MRSEKEIEVRSNRRLSPISMHKVSPMSVERFSAHHGASAVWHYDVQNVCVCGSQGSIGSILLPPETRARTAPALLLLPGLDARKIFYARTFFLNGAIVCSAPSAQRRRL